ncbi:hypothetical protein RUM43_015044 [Polyplax serrata]|uniref:Uncharacterized protein n=1 Tax=Polyplax serrata TaxID=468196 RepID=A0AAN8NIE7_POLSC
MSRQPMVVLSTSESDDDDGTTSRAAFRYLSEKVLEMPSPRRLRGRPRKEVGGGRSPEEDLTWRAKRQKLQRAASEVQTEATLDEALRGLTADAFPSATLAELQTMLYAATKVVVRVVTTSQSLKRSRQVIRRGRVWRVWICCVGSLPRPEVLDSPAFWNTSGLTTHAISIFAYYRVMLHLFAMNHYLSCHAHTLAANRVRSNTFDIAYDVQNLLMSVPQIPLSMYTILHCVGVTQTPDDYYPIPRTPQVTEVKYLTTVRPHKIVKDPWLVDHYAKDCLKQLLGSDIVSEFGKYSRSYYTEEGHYHNLWKYDSQVMTPIFNKEMMEAIRIIPFIPSSSSGWRYVGKKGVPGNHEKAISRAVLSLNWWLQTEQGIPEPPFRYNPDLAWTRTRLCTIDSPKIRHCLDGARRARVTGLRYPMGLRA